MGHYWGDVCVWSADVGNVLEKAFEVRDKPVNKSDVQIFGKKCVDLGVREAAVVMVSDSQEDLDPSDLSAWAADYGIGLTLFYGWLDFVDQVLFWANLPKPEAVLKAVEYIENRLIAVEASAAAITLWQKLVRE